MLDVYVCVGSSCHLRGSDHVVARLQRLIAQQGLEGRVTLNGSFCLDNCSGGVSVKVGEAVFGGIQPESAAEELLPAILAQLASAKKAAGAGACGGAPWSSPPTRLAAVTATAACAPAR